MSVRPLSREALPGARVTVWVDVAVGRHFERSVAVDYRVQAFRTGWVAAEELGRGQDLDATRLRQAQVDVAGLASPLWTDAPDNLRLRRGVRAGQALTVLDAEVRPWVARGQVVEVFSSVGDLAVQAQGEALQDGRAGQDVLVRIASSRAPVIGRVLKPGLVEIRQ
jgi:flagella basal body P-ring formation protein FlgA